MFSNLHIAGLANVFESTSMDILVILFFLAAGFLWGTMGGKSKLLSFLFATYVALFLSPLVFKVLDTEKILLKNSSRDIGIYLSILVIVFVILERIVFRSFSRSGYSWWQAFILSFLGVGIFVSGALNIVSLKGIIAISPLTHSLFAGSIAYLAWAILPLVGLLIVSRGK